jgi:hypothetical protein
MRLAEWGMGRTAIPMKAPSNMLSERTAAPRNMLSEETAAPTDMFSEGTAATAQHAPDLQYNSNANCIFLS